MARYALIISYDGTDFLGWQRQASGRTVQGVLEDVLERLNRGDRASVVGAGRTDSGVHATGQVAHVDIAHEYPTGELLYRMNRMLPDDVAVRNVERVPDDFHARFQAFRRRYRYRITPNRDPFHARYAWHVQDILSIPVMEEGARCLPGRREFTSLSKVNPDTPNMVCDLSRLELLEVDGGIEVVIESDRFLYGMVRIITGLLVDIGRGSRPVTDVAAILSSTDRSLQSQAAPAHGLYFERVWYPSD
jgi:tRNA pseudouridine38-40 synthase